MDTNIIKKTHISAKRRRFDPAVELVDFSEEEKVILQNYGSWMEALATGRIQPFTLEQSRFIAVAERQSSPASEFEILWIKYCQRIKDHKESETKRIMSLVDANALSYERLWSVLDNASKFSFTNDDIKRINEKIEGQKPLGPWPNSFVVFSTTDGQ